MNHMDSLWLKNPTLAYADWQAREAAGADRRPFSPQSVIQHRAMFEHFRRHLAATESSLATFGSDHIASFWLTPEGRAYTTSTQMRYLKLVDRLCRHLVAVGVRKSNPAEKLVREGNWPDGEPIPIFLDAEEDKKLQEYVLPLSGDSLAQLRSRATVALFLATGATVAEGRAAALSHLMLDKYRPSLLIPAHGARDARTVKVPDFALPILRLWTDRRAALPMAGDLLFTFKKQGQPATVASLGNTVRDALQAIGFEGEDMSPRVLRNTFCRRLLLAGVSRQEVAEQLGLASLRTCNRIAATIEHPSTSSAPHASPMGVRNRGEHPAGRSYR